ncbi:ABC transporter permease [Bifidobacterium callitrichos]|uniref:Multidrug ABC transporter permease n=1 Tax=Bifidobacterium callitrichos DSM 23973 TaxID=1437609 RepID=A0A086ZUY2_9BIFI|nr:ABC transporter permease [Bifidobacterium callitrichos]KFI50332.1 multidrug ABC transporter permease [Bifidobacterium callitrichos DSM 23973]
MWTTFVTTLKTNLHDKASMFWLIVFPLALATLFNMMFADLGSQYELKAVPLVTVHDTNWNNAKGASAFIDALSGEAEGTTGISQPLLDTTPADSVDKARDLIAKGDADGYLTVDQQGHITLTLATGTVAGMDGSSASVSGKSITISALDGAISLYNRTDTLTRKFIADNPWAATSRSFWTSLGATTGMTRETTLTNSAPGVSTRYFYALLAMACLMAMSYSIRAVVTAQANLSALGMRRSIAPLSRTRQFIAGFLASWLCASACLLVAFAYIRYVLGVPFGGREPAAVLAVVVGSFMACAFGTMIGAIPKLSYGVKVGMTSAIACTLSLFSGMYGAFAMSLSDWITRNLPVLALINPTQQVVNLFYDILYFDSYRPFLTTCGVLLAMSALFLAAGALMLKEQRYEHL